MQDLAVRWFRQHRTGRGAKRGYNASPQGAVACGQGGHPAPVEREGRGVIEGRCTRQARGLELRRRAISRELCTRTMRYLHNISPAVAPVRDGNVRRRWTRKGRAEHLQGLPDGLLVEHGVVRVAVLDALEVLVLGPERVTGTLGSW